MPNILRSYFASDVFQTSAKFQTKPVPVRDPLVVTRLHFKLNGVSPGNGSSEAVGRLVTIIRDDAWENHLLRPKGLVRNSREISRDGENLIERPSKGPAG